MSDEQFTDGEGKEQDNGIEIAVIGMAGRFPGAENISAFWKLLKDGVEAITWFSDEELLEAGVDPVILNDPNYVKSRCTIKDEDKFDAFFFDFSPREAELMDPQHRLFLEIAWEALENAGYNADTYDGLIGLFGGVSLNTYVYSYLLSQKGVISPAEGYQLSIGNDKDFPTTRISYKMNLKGPSVDVQTACSTSLVAIHIACQNLLNFNCDMAMAGGVSITIPQKQGYFYQEGMILSADGHCRAFDEKASGTISGSGAGMVVLKRLEDALADGDHIYAVIKGSAYNNDGSLRVGYTAPSVDGQAEVIGTAQAVADVDPASITYIEAHGTGTVLGDPIEITALTQIFRDYTDKKQFCAIGSVKTNIGHLDAAAGVAGFIKTVLALYNKQIPASLNYDRPNPKIDFENSPFFVNTELRDWQTDGLPRRAGVSSFGIGGTNAHVILEEAPAIEPSSASRPYHILQLSAKTSAALEQATDQLADFLSDHPDLALADAAYTLQVGRKAFNYRRILVAESPADAARALKNRDPKRLLSLAHGKEPNKPALVFMFSGQGAQYPNMGKGLYDGEPFFRETVDRCCRLLQPEMGLDLRTLLFPAAGQEDEAAEKLAQTVNTQPALFVIEYALAQLLTHWGLQPAAMIGHSIGEYVAACVAGVFSLEEALKLVAARGRLMQQLPTGKMLSLPLEENDVQPFLNEHISLAAVNGKNATVLSGTPEAITRLEEELKSKGVEYRSLRTSHAFHSAMMDSILDEFTAIVDKTTLNKPKIPYLSNLSGGWINEEEATSPAYYAKHLRHTVRFMDNLGAVLQETGNVLLEVGPGTTLSTLARRHPENTLGRVILSTMRHPRENRPDLSYLLTTIGYLWLSGADMDYTAFYKDEKRNRVALPSYPFEKKRYWLEAKGGGALLGNRAEDEGKKSDLADWFYVPVWNQRYLSTAGGKDENPGRFLFFSSDSPLENALLEQLTRQGHVVYTVRRDSGYQASDSSCTINPLSADNYIQLVKHLKENDSLPDTIIHCWNYDNEKTETDFDALQARGFQSLVYLVQALSKENINRPAKVILVGNNLFDVIGSERLVPEKTTLLGAAKILPQEFPHLAVRIIDIDAATSGPRTRTLLYREITQDSDALLVALRGDRRWVQDYVPFRFETENPLDGYLREQGVYVITGGLGRIGLHLAEFLAKKTRARLALLEVTDFPKPESWDTWLQAQETNDPISRKIKRLQDIEQNGGQVMIIRTDITDHARLKQALDEVQTKWGAVNGVIHAAGSVGRQAFQLIPEITDEHWKTQFAAKAKGALALAEVLPEYNADFCLLQSSLSSVLGGLGFAAYAAANQFLDALAARENRNGMCQWISVNWDGWKFDEESADESGIGAEIAKLSVLPQEGIRAFERIFSQPGFGQIIVSTGSLQQRLQKWLYGSKKDEDSSAAQRGELHSRPNLATAFVEPETDLQKQVAAEWQKLLGIEPIGIYDDFFDLGGNSLLGTQLIAKMRETFQIDVPLRSLFEDPTVSGVARVIEEAKTKTEDSDLGKVAELLKQVENLSDEEVNKLLKEKKEAGNN